MDWYSDALRAFLDRDRFYQVEWSHKTVNEDGTRDLIIIGRKDGAITLESYQSDTKWTAKCDYGMPVGDEAWVPLDGIIEGHHTSNAQEIAQISSIFFDSIISKRGWTVNKRSGVTFEASNPDPDIDPDGYNEPSFEDGPRWIYRTRSSGICTYCGKLPSPDQQLRSCANCRSAGYRSKECQTSDWQVHKNLCLKVRKKAQERRG